MPSPYVGTDDASPLPQMKPFRATVLIVDDEDHALNGLGQALFKTEYRLLFAHSPHEALEIMRQEKVDIVLSDNLMPGMTGLEFLKLVHDRYPDTVRIMLTGMVDTRTLLKAINQGEIYRFLVKPCDRDELLVTLYLAVEKLELERENRHLLALIRANPDLARLLDEQSGPKPNRPD